MKYLRDLKGSKTKPPWVNMMRDNVVAALRKVTTDAKDVEKPPKDELIPWLYGNCWSFSLALEEVYGYELQLLKNKDDDDPDLPEVLDHAFTTRGAHAIDAAGVTTIPKLLKRYDSEIDKDEDELGSLINDMSMDYSDAGYSIDDAVKFIRKYHDFYNISSGIEGYELTPQEIRNVLG